MQSKGWIKLHRQINENVFLSKDNTAYMVFVRLLTVVNSKGEWAGGREQLGKIMNLNHNTLYKVVKRLEQQQLINITSNSKYSIYTICKWHKYQDNGNSSSNSRVTARQQHGNTLIRIENKELESDIVSEDSPAYRKARETIERIKQNAASPGV